MTDASDGLTGLAAMPDFVQHSLSSTKEREFQFQFLLNNCHDRDIPPSPVHPQSRLHTALFTLNSP